MGQRSKTEYGRKRNDEYFSLVSLVICVAFWTVGNALYHSPIFSLPVAGIPLDRWLEIPQEAAASPLLFLTSVILAARGDIACLFLIAFSMTTKIPRVFSWGVVAYRSVVFGFGGAHFVDCLFQFSNFSLWLTFFLYHVFYFAVLICFIEATIRLCDLQPQLLEKVRYAMSLLAECSLIIFLNLVYYFLIFKIKS